MTKEILVPRTINPGDKVALLSPAWAAPAYFPQIHEQAVARLQRLLDVVVVEYPTTRQMGASPEERAADVNAAFADPEIRAILTTVGGRDEIRLIRHLDPALPQADPKPFFGYSDNTNILNWLWSHGVGGYYGGATQVHFGPGTLVDAEHLITLRAALFGRGDTVLPATTDSQDYGYDWSSPEALTEDSRAAPPAQSSSWAATRSCGDARGAGAWRSSTSSRSPAGSRTSQTSREPSSSLKTRSG